MKRILSFLKPLKKYVVLCVFLVFLSQGLSLLLPLLMSMMVNNGITKGDTAYIKTMGGCMLSAAALSVAVSVCNAYYTSYLSTQYGRILREKVFMKVESLSLCDIDKIGTASLITRSTNDCRQLQDFVLTGMRMILAAPVMLIGGTVMAFIMNPKLASTILIILPIIAGIAGLVIKAVVPLFKKRQKLTDTLNHLVREKLSGIRVIRAFRAGEYEDSRFDEKNGELADLTLKIARIFAVLIPCCIVIVFCGVSLLIWASAKNINTMDPILQADKIQNTVGDLQAFLIYMIMIVAALTMAGAMFVIVPRASISAKRILEVLDLEPSIKQAEEPKSIDGRNGCAVEFRHVDFTYPRGNRPVLEDVSFTANPGEITAIIGGTGSGKSSLIHLIPRFYDVSGGAILVGGTDVRELNGEELNKKIGYVPQTASLFSGTVAENIRFGKKDASDQEIQTALQVAQASEFVEKLEGKTEFSVSQGGMNLSGGQKQRLSIARAVVRQADIYLFDDSFSALDFKTDALVRQAIRKYLKNATVLVVAQRVGTVLNADRIVVLDEGRVVGIGTHTELLENCSVYREIVESQLSADSLREGV